MRTIERDDFVFSLTYGGETVSLAAAKAAIRVLREEPVIDRIFERGRALREGYEAVAEAVGMSDATACRGLPPFLSVTFDVAGDAPAKSLFMQECVERGVLFDGTHLVSYSHTEQDVEYTLEVYREALESLSDAVEQDAVEDRLEGRPIGAPLRDD